MESHRYKKTRGAGAVTTQLTPAAKPAPSKAEAADAALCQHLDARVRALPRVPQGLQI